MLNVQDRTQEKSEEFIGNLPRKERERIVAEIEKLPDGEDIKPMRGHTDLFRLRVGSYRILYTVDNNQYIVLVIDAGNRGDIYKRY